MSRRLHLFRLFEFISLLTSFMSIKHLICFSVHFSLHYSSYSPLPYLLITPHPPNFAIHSFVGVRAKAQCCSQLPDCAGRRHTCGWSCQRLRLSMGSASAYVSSLNMWWELLVGKRTRRIEWHVHSKQVCGAKACSYSHAMRNAPPFLYFFPLSSPLSVAKHGESAIVSLGPGPANSFFAAAGK